MKAPRTRLLVATTIPETAWTIMRGQLRHLQKNGFDVVLVSSPGTRLAETGLREGVEVRPVPMRRELSPRADLGAVLQLLGLLRAERVDVSYVGTPKAGLLVGLAAVAARIPTRVYLLRGLRLETERGWRRAVLWAAEWVAIRCAHQVIVVSPSLRTRARELRLLGKSAGVVLGRGASNGIDLEAFAPTAANRADGVQLRCTLGIDQDAFVFGFVGRLTVDKGIGELAEAFARVQAILPECWLLLAGAQELARLPPPTQEALETLPNVRFAGWREDTAAVYQAIDCLVLPTYREGLPNVALEAAAAGRPVITTTATGAVDSILDGETGLLVRARSWSELASAMTALAASPDLAGRLGEAGREFVARYYSNEVVWNALVTELAG